MLASLRWLDSASARAPTEEWFASIRYNLRAIHCYNYTGIQYIYVSVQTLMYPGREL